MFLLWSRAREQEQRILADLAREFAVLEVLEVTWTGGETFARNLTRMYGEALPSGSDKEQHCGSGPFLAVVVEDRRPRRRLRRTRRGIAVLNLRVHEARARYREWTGGGFRVHASDSVGEADRDLVLLFGRPARSFRGRSWDCVVRAHPHDLVGTDGWTGFDELLLALRVHSAEPEQEVAGSPDALAVRAQDGWWAEKIAGGRELGPGVREIRVADRPVRLTVREPAPSRLARARAAVRRIGRLPDA